MIRTSGIINSSVTNTRFNVYSSKEIEKISVVKITSAKSLDLGGNPIDNGLYDARFGPLRQEDICATCGLTGRHCPGHCGHIELPLLCLNPNFIDDIRKLLAMTCFKKNCNRILYSKDFKQEFTQAVKEAYEGNCSKALSLDKKIVQTEIDLDEAENEKKAKADLYEDPEEYATYLKMQKNPKIQQTTHIGTILNDLVKHFFRKTKSRNCPHCMQPIGKIKIIRGFKFFHYEDAGVIKNMGKEQNDSEDEEEFDNVEDFEKKHDVRNNAFLMTEEIRKVLKDMYKEEWNLINAIFNIKGGPNFELFAGVLFIDRLMVTPSRFRPIAMRAEQKYEGQQTTMYAKIIESCVSIQDNNRELIKLNNSEYEIDEVTGKKVRGIDGMEIQTLAEEEKEDKIKMIQRTMNHAVDSLQQRVGEIFNGDLNKTDPIKPVGVKQILEKKKGLFRMNIMGKRVNFSARSVAGPDPYISTVEVGIPEMFAKTLTYPVGVTPFNAKELAALVRNGPNNYPGAYAIIDGEGQKVLISKDELKREKQASHLTLCAEDGNIKRVSVVLRHIRNGDSLLVNRQPTLHKGSIMAHRARILQGGNTVKIHYANCKSYNADFDGDEINVHALQNEEARAEALMLMSSEQMYVSAKDGGPLAGLLQDHMIAGFHMMVRDTFLTREQYMQLSWSALDCVDRVSVRVKTLPPAVWKPVPMWTGKQVISTLLINLIGRGETGITFRSSSKVNNKSWVEKHVKSGEHLDKAPYGPKWMDGKEYSMDESRVLVRDSEFLQGILDKSQTGASKFGFVHYIFELYGANKSGQVLTAMTRVGTEFLKTIQGFTLGLADVQINAQCDIDRKAKKKLLNKDLSMKLKEEYNIEDEDDLTLTSLRAIKNAYADISGGKSAELDQRIKGLANMKGNEFKDVTKLNADAFPYNNLAMMIETGAKGSSTHRQQMGVYVGQMELEGKRPPFMYSGRRLPCFGPYNPDVRSGGFIADRFGTGLRPPEYFFNAQAGREGLIDTAVKTSRSGYLQRSLIKVMESLVVNHDQSVRDSDNSVVQFIYGEDGINPQRAMFTETKLWPFYVDNLKALEKNYSYLQLDKKGRPKHERFQMDGIEEKNIDICEKVAQSQSGVKVRNSPFMNFCRKQRSKYEEITREELVEKWNNLSNEKKEKFEDEILADPIISEKLPAANFGYVSEKFENDLAHAEKGMAGLVNQLHESAKTSKRETTKAKHLMKAKFQRTACEGGEHVGIIAAQSIGEPSTQMTLNTFHHAGNSDMNVTLGIPRLREILMTASPKPKTPFMKVNVLDSAPRDQIWTLCKKLNKVMFSDVIATQTIDEKFDFDLSKGGLGAYRKCEMKIELIPEWYMKSQYALDPADVEAAFESNFLGKLLAEIGKTHVGKRASESLVKGKKDRPAGGAAVAMQEVKDDDFNEKEGEKSDDEEEMMGEKTAKEEDKDRMNNEEEELEDSEDEDEVTDKNENGENLEDDEYGLDDGSKWRGNMYLVPGSYKYNLTAEKPFITMAFKLHYVNTDIGSIFETLSKKLTIREVHGINRTFLKHDNTDQKWYIQIEGVNIEAIFDRGSGLLDLSSLYSNDIWSILRFYGVDAAVKTIQSEIAGVFKVYGIAVDPRHLSMIADFMCMTGKFQGFNRRTLASSRSPWLQMSFEAAINCLKTCVIQKSGDNMRSPSSRLVTGQPLVTLSEPVYKM